MANAEMDCHPKFDNLLDALEARDAGVEVEESHIRDLVKDLQGDHECAICFEPEGDFRSISCSKNPGHMNFIPAKDFKLEDLPPNHRTQHNFESLQLWSTLTVKITARYVSLERPAKFPDGTSQYPFFKCKGSSRVRRFGSGYVSSVLPVLDNNDINNTCPCLLCRDSDTPYTEFWFVNVYTATHVIYDGSEASDAVIDCFYDCDDDVSGVKKIYGLCMDKEDSNLYEDNCNLIGVTHDRDLIEKLNEALSTHKKTVIPHYRNDLGVLISHPHGQAKRITVGHVLHLSIPICPEYPTKTPIKFTEETECRLPLLPWSQNELLPDLFHANPGEIFQLPDGLRYILPENSKFARRFFDVSKSWFVFPSGTVFMFEGNVLTLPPEAEFRFNTVFENPLSYLTYDIDSCPGSSGAGLLQDGGQNLFSTFPHSGSLSLYNKSGLCKYAIITIQPEQTNNLESETSGWLEKICCNFFTCFYPN